MIKKTINIPIYNHILELIIFNNYEELKTTKYWKSIECSYASNFEALTIDCNNKNKNVIIIPTGRLDLLVHELVHVKNTLNNSRHFDLSDECEAYLMEWMFASCQKYFNVNNKEK